MSNKIWTGAISDNTDWGGDETTDNLPVAGKVIQDYLKSNLLDKIGYIYHDQLNGNYLCFASSVTKDEYLADPTKVHLIKGTLKAPLGYTASVNLLSTPYQALLLGTTGNRLQFGFDIKDSSNNPYIDNINYIVTIKRNATEYVVNGTCAYGKTVELDIDEYLLSEGTISFIITITGVTTMVTASTVATYDIINLVIENNYNSALVYDTSAGDPLTFNYTLFGSSNIKYVEWYLDGILQVTDTHTGGTVDALQLVKTFSVEDLSGGVHSIQFRSYVIINGDRFYTDTLYREFIVVKESTPDICIALETSIPSDPGIVTSPKLFNVKQYEPYTFEFGAFNKQNLESLDVDIIIDGKLTQTLKAKNSIELSYTFIPSTVGTSEIILRSGNVTKSIIYTVENTNMDIVEITDNRSLLLSAVGRSNNDSNKNSWSYGSYSTSFSNFTWNSTSGWCDNRLVIGEGMTITNSIKPLESNANGKTIEIEFESINVIDDDAVICDIRDSSGVGLLITASEASLRVSTAVDQIVSTKYKSGENHRIGFVLDNLNKLALIYVDGIVSGSIKITSTNFSVNKKLIFKGTTKAGIKLKQVIVFNTSLNSNQILNNYILYRDTIQEMLFLYNRNDILEGTLISIDKVSKKLPVMLLTGDVNWINTQTSKDAETSIDAEYIDTFHPERCFKLKGGRLRLQGTSSSAYPIKNFRLYTKRKNYIGVLTDYKGEIISNNKFSFRLNPDSNLEATPVNCWCLKADYAESSSTHNTGIANIWNRVMYWAYDNSYSGEDPEDAYVCRTKAQKVALREEYEYDVRTTVDGFPIAVFSRQSENDQYVFVGKYNFNNDKSTESVFGFCDIPGFDNSKVQCWETLENGNNYALFQTTDGWFDPVLDSNGNPKYEDDLPVLKWSTAFESRYPDDGLEADTTDLKAFCDWVCSCDDEKFYNEKKDHLDLWKVAAYYVYLYRFGAVDQVVKNSMIMTEDGIHFFYINYDNDTINGLKNTGALVYPPTITRDTLDGNTYAYAGHDSRLWNLLEGDEEFMRYVSRVDTLLYKAGLSYETVLRYFNDNQSDKWCERIYNQDAIYKYITPSLTTNAAGSEVNTLFMLQGSRKAHRTWWLAKRFKLMDGKFNNEHYTSQNSYLKLNGSPGLDITIKAADYMYYGCKSNSVDIQMGVELQAGESYTFHKDPSLDENGVPIPGGKDFAVGDPVYIYAPYVIEELDLSSVAPYLEELTLNVSDPVLGTRLKKLIINTTSSTHKGQVVNFIEGLGTATSLEYLDIRGLNIGSLNLTKLTLLEELLAGDSGLAQLELADGCIISKLQLPSKLNSLKLSNLPNLTMSNIEGFNATHVSRLEINNCKGITSDYASILNWVRHVKPGDVLDLTGIEWTDINPVSLIEFGKVKMIGATLKLKGKIQISNLDATQVTQLQDIFGSTCFTNNAELWISAPESIFIHGKSEMRSGDKQTLTSTIFSDNPGEVTWSVEEGSEWVSSIISNSDNTGTITTIEDTVDDHVIVIKAAHKPSNYGSNSIIKIDTFQITLKKVVYATSGSITGDMTIKKTSIFKLVVSPSNTNGDYTTTWQLDIPSDTDPDNPIIDNKIKLTSPSKSQCTVSYLKSIDFALGTLIAKVKNKIGTEFEVRATVTITNDQVVMTSTSNPAVIKVCYEHGWCNNPDVMYKEEAQKVMSIGNAFTQNKEITSFNEFKEFSNVKIINDQAFRECTGLRSIELPNSLESIGSFAFIATPSLSTIFIPNNVSDIKYNSFHTSNISEFTVNNGNNNYYKSINGVLYTIDGKLVKYPEGKKDKVFTIPDEVTSLSKQSLYNTKLETLVISDQVNSIDQSTVEVISENKNLTLISLGKSFPKSMIAQLICKNPILENIEVSSLNSEMTSIDGVIYSKDGKTLIKYPEGRSTFNVIDTITELGAYAVSYNSSLIGELRIPDSVQIVSECALFSCINITKIKFTELSSLKELKSRSFQLISNVESIILPPSLEKLYDMSLSSIPKLSELRFMGSVPPVFMDGPTPTKPTTVFGDKLENFSGRDASVRQLRVPADGHGYESDLWENSILAKDRNNFILLKSD